MTCETVYVLLAYKMDAVGLLFKSGKTSSTYNSKNLFCHASRKKNGIAFSLPGTDYVVMHMFMEERVKAKIYIVSV